MGATERLGAGSLGRAAELLRGGELVAFPTETVYGLGADATSEAAVLGIYRAKGRPSSNPLIVHVASVEEARALAGSWPEAARRLAEAFWPGPLTVVVPAGPAIAGPVLAGGTTVGLRMPDHGLALELIRRTGRPLAAPSANRSNALSPTTAEAVLDTLDGRIAAVLDGGPCAVGIESTVADVSGDGCRVLRPGAVTAGALAEVLGGQVESGAAPDAGGTLRSPGQFPRHYAPRIPLTVGGSVEGEAGNTFVIRFGDELRWDRREALLPSSAAACARWLYLTLRAAEQSGAERIAMESPPDGPEWMGVRDRLRRASTP